MQYRLLFFVDKAQAVFVHAFIKKTDRVPRKDIEQAKFRRGEYQKPKEE